MSKRDLSSSSGIRCLCARIADATGQGVLDPRKANSMLFAVGIAARQLEMELAEKLSGQLAAIIHQPPAAALSYHSHVVDGEYVPQ